MYRWVDHTAELELAIEAAGPEEVLADALAALGELLEPDAVPALHRDAEAVAPRGPRRRPGVAACASRGAERRTVEVSARDDAGLFAAWLEELVFLAESEGFVGEALVDCSLAENHLTTVVEGRLGAPPPVIKAVTYHRLAFETRGDGYVANVVLDV